MGRALKSRNPGVAGFIIGGGSKPLSKRPFPWKLWRVGERNNKSSSKPKLPGNDPRPSDHGRNKGTRNNYRPTILVPWPISCSSCWAFWIWSRDRPCGISGPKLNASRVTISELLLERASIPILQRGSSLKRKIDTNREARFFSFLKPISKKIGRIYIWLIYRNICNCNWREFLDLEIKENDE